MKSKTILSEAERRGIVAQLKGASCYKNSGELILNALVAVEEEIAHKDLVIKGYIFNEWQFEKELNDKYKELESRRLIIERLHNENQALIEENAGLKAENKKYSIYRNS